MKLFFIGFMGCGKSFVGRQIAGALQLPFYDLDTEIEKKEQVAIAEIFDEMGENHFRELETEMLDSFLNKADFVLSTGGGTPCFGNNLEKMKMAGFVIYIKATPDFLLKRLAPQADSRPLLRQQQDLEGFVAGKLQERAVYYEQAHLIYDLNEKSEPKIVEELTHYLSRFRQNFS